MTERQRIILNLVSEELGNIMGDFLYEDIANGLKGRDLDKINQELDTDLKVALTQLIKEL